MIKICKHKTDEDYSIFGFYIGEKVGVWVSKSKLIELRNELNKLNLEEG